MSTEPHKNSGQGDINPSREDAEKLEGAVGTGAGKSVVWDPEMDGSPPLSAFFYSMSSVENQS